MRPVSLLHAANVGKLLERGDARLVDHVVLAVLHDADAERRALVRNAGAQHQLDAPVFQHLLLGLCLPHLRIPLQKGRRQIRLLGVGRDQLAAAPRHRFHLTVDVRVVHADDAELDARCRFLHGGARYRNGTGEPRDEFTAIYLVFLHVSPCQTVARL